jgi:mannose-1-phosphate guanylyltransferase/mannose-6-phosphate isomerase
MTGTPSDRPTLYPVVLSGGSGTRLWPMSRAAYPKQLLPLLSEHSLLQQTVARAAGIGGCAEPLILANDEHRFVIAEQLRQIDATPRGILLEPVARNTAPAVAAAAVWLTRHDPAALMLVMPSDHTIRDLKAFARAVATAREAAESGRLVTFGIEATKPETGYGYIRRGAALEIDGAFAVAAFVEKPDEARARAYLASGDYSWNSGMFLFPAVHYLAELERRLPGTVAAVREAVETAAADLDFVRLGASAFAKAENVSVDYAVMEHTDKAAVVPAALGWSDVGAWDALWEISEVRDEAGNVLHGDVIALDCRNTYLRSEEKLVAALGVDDLIVVATADAILVAPRSRAQEIGAVVASLKQTGREEVTHAATVHRPWGTYRSIHVGERVQVKHIVVKPGGRLSLQMHHHRAEHWVVVRGTARVVRDDEELILTENQSIYIPLGARHRLENPGKIPLHLIEVQSGAYLGEDDIVRFEDNYGRR